MAARVSAIPFLKTVADLGPGTNNQSADIGLDVEPNLDFQYAMGIVGKNATVYQYQIVGASGTGIYKEAWSN